MRLLQRLGLHACVFETPEVALKIRALLGPERFHDLQRFLEACYASLRGYAESGVFLGASAQADAHGEPSVAELVDSGERFCELHRISRVENDDGHAQTDAFGHRCKVGKIRDRLELEIRTEYVLGQPTVVEAHGFRLADVVAQVGMIDALLGKILRQGNPQPYSAGGLHSVAP